MLSEVPIMNLAQRVKLCYNRTDGFASMRYAETGSQHQRVHVNAEALGPFVLMRIFVELFVLFTHDHLLSRR